MIPLLTIVVIKTERLFNWLLSYYIIGIEYSYLLTYSIYIFIIIKQSTSAKGSENVVIQFDPKKDQIKVVLKLVNLSVFNNVKLVLINQVETFSACIFDFYSSGQNLWFFDYQFSTVCVLNDTFFMVFVAESVQHETLSSTQT